MDELEFLAARKAEREALEAEQESKTEVETEDSQIEQPEVDTEVAEETVEETAQPEEDAEESVVEEAEESEEETETEDDIDEVFYELADGDETITASAKEIKDLRAFKESNKDAGLRQDDYTRKSQANKEFENKLTAREQTLADREAIVEAIIAEHVKTPEELADIREQYGAEEYLDTLEKQNAILEKAKEGKLTPSKHSQEYLQAEQAKLIESNPTWFNEKGELTEQYYNDEKSLNEVCDKYGFTQEQKQELSVSNAGWKVIQDAAKYQELMKKSEGMQKKVKKAQVVSKSAKKSQVSSAQRTYNAANKAYAANPTSDNFVKLRAAERKLKNK